jgi:hypothetical protein
MLKQGTLLTFLGELKDPRRLQGQRYKYPVMLITVIMCALCNKSGYRETGRFCKNNRKKISQTF